MAQVLEIVKISNERERDGHIAGEHRKMELPMWMK